MREHGHESDAAVELRPKADRVPERDAESGAYAAAASAGRGDVEIGRAHV